MSRELLSIPESTCRSPKRRSAASGAVTVRQRMAAMSSASPMPVARIEIDIEELETRIQLSQDRPLPGGARTEERNRVQIRET